MHHSSDSQLVALVALADASEDFALDVTLTLPGGVICGNLIGYSTWLRKQAALLQPSGHSRYIDYLNKLADLVQENQKNSSVDPLNDPRYENDPTVPLCIHLADAFYVHPTVTIPANEDLLWRGRISEVSGWSTGVFKPQQTD